MKKENGLRTPAIGSGVAAQGLASTARGWTSSCAAGPANLPCARHVTQHHHPPVRQKRAPNCPGTIRFLKQFAVRSVCVRCRYDEAKTTRYTNVEPIVDEKEVLGRYSNLRQSWLYPTKTTVYVRVAYEEVSLRRQKMRMVQ